VRAVLPFLLVLVAASAARADHPPDPYADEYRLPVARELGSTAGQFRIVPSLALGVDPRDGGLDYGLAGTLELMTFAYLGVRGTLAMAILRPEGAPFVFSAKAGPSLQLLPYRRVGLTLFFEGGIAAVDSRTKHSFATPIVSPGGTLELWFASSAFVRAQAHLDWAAFEAKGAPETYLRVVGLLGLGLAL
jgi:hypothetical protein